MGVSTWVVRLCREPKAMATTVRQRACRLCILIYKCTKLYLRMSYTESLDWCTLWLQHTCTYVGRRLTIKLPPTPSLSPKDILQWNSPVVTWLQHCCQHSWAARGRDHCMQNAVGHTVTSWLALLHGDSGCSVIGNTQDTVHSSCISSNKQCCRRIDSEQLRSSII